MSKTAIVISSMVAGIALIGGGTAAYATMTMAAKPSSVYACVKKGVVDTSLSTGARKCASGQTLVEIGARGATGARGPAGPTTAGSAGLNVVVSTATGMNGTGVAWCPAANPYVLGGGANLPLTSSYPANKTNGAGAYATPGTHPETGVGGWGVSYNGPTPVTVYAICSK